MVLTLIVNFIVTSRVDAATPRRRLEILLLVTLLGMSACAFFVVSVCLTAATYWRVNSLGPEIRVQKGEMGETCLAILSCGIATFLMTSINVLLI